MTIYAISIVCLLAVSDLEITFKVEYLWNREGVGLALSYFIFTCYYIFSNVVAPLTVN